MNADLSEYIYNMARIEQKGKLFKPEYLQMDSDEEEAERVCSRCEKCDTPDEYCFNVWSRMDDKELILSFSNRMIDALLKHGYWLLPTFFDRRRETIRPVEGEVNFYWDSEYGASFCRRCSMYGKAQCPEDVYDKACNRNATVRAIEQIVATVNELL